MRRRRPVRDGRLGRKTVGKKEKENGKSHVPLCHCSLLFFGGHFLRGPFTAKFPDALVGSLFSSFSLLLIINSLIFY
jgi:hypothetical protein